MSAHLVYRLKVLLLRIAFLPFAPPLLLGRVLFGLRMGGVGLSNRLGHFAGNFEAHLRRRKMGLEPAGERLVAFIPKAANRQLLKMLRREIVVVESPRLAMVYEILRPLIRLLRCHAPLDFRSREYREYNLGVPALTLTNDEERRGRDFLASIGMTDKDWFVCFHSRDPTYLQHIAPTVNFDYHNYRDSSVTNYLPATRVINEKGGFALRMGAAVAEALPNTADARTIDYATLFRSDFLDVFLSARCRFYLGNSAGLVMLPTIFGRRVAWANAVPFTSVPYNREDIFIPKLLRDRNTGAYLSLAEAVQRNLHEAGVSVQFAAANVDLVENSAEEIVDLVEEMLDHLDGLSPPKEYAEMQDAFRQRFMKKYDNYQYSGTISWRFLARHPFLLAG